MVQIKNVLATSKAALAQDMTQLQGQISELQQRLDDVDRKFRGIERDAIDIEGEVSDLVRSCLSAHVCSSPCLDPAILKAAYASSSLAESEQRGQHMQGSVFPPHNGM